MSAFTKRSEFLNQGQQFHQMIDWTVGSPDVRVGGNAPRLRRGERFRSVVPGSSPPVTEEREQQWGIAPPVEGTQRPLRHVFRAVSEEDYQKSTERGYHQSDSRMNLCSSEGTCASTDPRAGGFYLPSPGEGRIMRIDVHPEDNWWHDRRDSYVKTPDPVPMSRVSAVSPKITQVAPDPAKPWKIRTEW